LDGLPLSSLIAALVAFSSFPGFGPPPFRLPAGPPALAPPSHSPFHCSAITSCPFLLRLSVAWRSSFLVPFAPRPHLPFFFVRPGPSPADCPCVGWRDPSFLWLFCLAGARLAAGLAWPLLTFHPPAIPARLSVAGHRRWLAPFHLPSPQTPHFLLPALARRTLDASAGHSLCSLAWALCPLAFPCRCCFCCPLPCSPPCLRAFRTTRAACSNVVFFCGRVLLGLWPLWLRPGASLSPGQGPLAFGFPLPGLRLLRFTFLLLMLLSSCSAVFLPERPVDSATCRVRRSVPFYDLWGNFSFRSRFSILGFPVLSGFPFSPPLLPGQFPSRCSWPGRFSRLCSRLLFLALPPVLALLLGVTIFAGVFFFFVAPFSVRALLSGSRVWPAPSWSFGSMRLASDRRLPLL